ncbi:MAG: AMP-binding protein [Deltaproteobacteria bacterium]|nr:AMP-binding protein [Deltaproteobacteria bacterium]
MSEPLQFMASFTLGAQLEARAAHEVCGSKVFLMQDDRTWTYRQLRDEALRTAHFLRGRLEPVRDGAPGHVAMLLENHFELVSLLFGCAYAGYTLFGINTGLRGETLAGVVNQSRARMLIVDERLLPEVERVRGLLTTVPSENILVLRARVAGGRTALSAGHDWLAAMEKEVGPVGTALEPPAVEVEPASNLMVIYTSGTTGLPKGINNNHMKLCAVGMVVSSNLGLGQDDVGYACMPLFHSNAIFVGMMPAFWVGGGLGVSERFSASGFTPDVFRYGVTFWNYVGEPVHYVLAALAKQYGGDEKTIAAEVTRNPKNRFRYAVGNGAAPPDIDKFVRWFGLDDMFELYGSTEAAISTFRRKGDPRGSVGEITDPAVKILNEKGGECPPAELGADGKILNYHDAVGEICRVAPDTSLFQGYFDNPEANHSKYRDGVYHSGDLGHVLERDGTRFLYFDGRTDDWIRKDGENFSALQVARLLQEHPDVVLAAAYGVPCAVSDELVMAALKLREGVAFDPQAFFAYCEEQITGGSMDRKWFPDFIRLVDEFDYTNTAKILVRNLKQVHFCRKRLPDAPLFWRTRGSAAYEPFTAADYDGLRATFAKAERLELLDR